MGEVRMRNNMFLTQQFFTPQWYFSCPHYRLGVPRDQQSRSTCKLFYWYHERVVVKLARRFTLEERNRSAAARRQNNARNMASPLALAPASTTSTPTSTTTASASSASRALSASSASRSRGIRRTGVTTSVFNGAPVAQGSITSTFSAPPRQGSATARADSVRTPNQVRRDRRLPQPAQRNVWHRSELAKMAAAVRLRVREREEERTR